MGGGNGQKSKTARERNMEKQKAAKGNRNKKIINVFTVLSKVLILVSFSLVRIN